MGPAGRMYLALCDQDWGWWPFVKLRPKKTERFTFGRCVLLSLGYGLVYGSAIGVLLAAQRKITWPSIIVVIMTLALAMVVYLPFCAWVWNKRAAELRASQRVG